MDSKSPIEHFRSTGSDDGGIRNDMTGNLPRPNSRPSVSPGNVHFCDGLIHGLDNLPPMSAAGASSPGFSATSWSPPTVDPLNPFAYGGWTAYPTDADVGDAPFSAPEALGSPSSASVGYMPREDYFRSLSQPDSTSATENQLHTTTSRTRSHSEHYDVLGGVSGVDFSQLAQSGHDLYAESMDQWNQPNHRSQDSRSYDPFGTMHVLQQQSEGPSARSTPSYIAQTVEMLHSQHQKQQQQVHTPPQTSLLQQQQLQQPHQPQIHPTTPSPPPPPTPPPPPPPQHKSPVSPKTSEPAVKNRPSYSDVAKNRPSLDPKSFQKKNEQTAACSKSDDSSGSGSRLEGFPDFTGITQHKTSSRSRSSKYHKPKKRQPGNIKPDSRYGLDTFEDCTPRSGSADHLSVSSGSRKGSTSSGTGSYCVDDSDTVDSVKRSSSVEEQDNDADFSTGAQPWMDGKLSSSEKKMERENELKISKSSSQEKEAPAAGKFDDGKRKTQAVKDEAGDSKRARSSPSTSSSEKPKDSVKEKVFFDPKRIFGGTTKAKPTNKTPSTEQSSSPNTDSSNFHKSPKNQTSQTSQPKQSVDPDNILNNDKPKTKQSSNISGSCYINNNLKDHAPQPPPSAPNTASTSSKKQTNSDTRQAAPRPGAVPRHRAGIGRPGGRHSVRRPPGARPEPPRPAPASTDRSPRDDGPPRRRTSERVPSTSYDPQPVIGDLILQMWHWFSWASQELGYVVWNITKLTISIGLALMLMLSQYTFATVKSAWAMVETKVFRSGADKSNEAQQKRTRTLFGLKENIVLPSTGEEAMRRLLAGKGKDPYSILGVTADASDEIIKKYYRRQAVLVHPDKNQMLGAEEAFKILGHAFDLIGEPEKRKHFDTQRLEAEEKEEALHQFTDLLSKLNEKMQEASNLMRCENCGGKHRRVPTDRPMYAARYCQRCDYNHPVREGDVWAESHMLGFLWNYYACMENRVYDITEWASCQCDRFKHIQANAHQIVYRIATNGNTGGRHRQNQSRTNEADIEDLLSHLFHQTTQGSNSPGTPSSPEGAGEGFPGAQPSRPSGSAWNQSSGASSSKKGGRRKKKRH